MSILYDDKWSLTPKQQRSIVNSNSRMNIWYGGVRSGKTLTSSIRWLDYLARNPQGAKAMVGKTQRTLIKNVLTPIRELIGEDNFELNKGESWAKLAGHKVDLYGANDERALEKIAGVTLGGAYLDEVSLHPHSMFKMTSSRCSIPNSKIFATTNPGSPEHWLKRKYLDRENDMNLTSFHFRLEDNKSLSDEYIRDLKNEYDGVWYDRYIEGLWVLAEGLVYDMYDRDEHIVDTLPKIKDYWVGIDYGTTASTAFVLIGLGDDGRLYIVDEYKHSGKKEEASKTDIQYARDFINWLGDIEPNWICIDPSAKSFRLQLWDMQDQCNSLNSLRKGDNKVLDGIRLISSLLSSNSLYIHRSCDNVIKELGLYSWDKKAQARGEDKPIKKHDHCLDAMRYGIKGIGSNITRKLLTESR